MSVQEMKRLKKALMEIATMGYGMKDEVRDWGNIGRNAVFKAREALAVRCGGCGKNKEFKLETK